MKFMKLVLIALLFTACGSKPPAKIAPVEPDYTQSPKLEPLRSKPDLFKAEKVEEGVIFYAPYPEDGIEWQLSAAYQVFKNDQWCFVEKQKYEVLTDVFESSLGGWLFLPPEQTIYAVRVVVKNSAGKYFAVESDPFFRKDEKGNGGYDFIVNIRTGEIKLVP